MANGTPKRRATDQRFAEAVVENSYVKLGTAASILIMVGATVWMVAGVFSNLQAEHTAIRNDTALIEKAVMEMSQDLKENVWTRDEQKIWCRLAELENRDIGWRCSTVSAKPAEQK